MSVVNKVKENPKVAFYTFDVVFAFILVIVMTFGSFILDPTHTNWGKWAADTTILLAIQLGMIVVGTNASRDRSMNNENGLFQRSLADYNSSLKQIKDRKLIPTFSQFFFWYRNRENYENRISALMSWEFDGLEAVYIVNYVKTEDLDELAKKAIKKTDKNGNEIIIQRIAEDKIDIVREVLEGASDVKANSYAYYLSAFTDSKTPRSVLDQGAYFEGKARQSRNLGTAVKVGSFLVISALVSMITIYQHEGGASDPALWFSLFTRLCSMVGGATSGWLGGAKEVKFQAAAIISKNTVLHDYIVCYDSHEFVPKNYEELAKEQWELQVEQEAKAKAEEEPQQPISLELVAEIAKGE